jgi:hypothetical protein
VAASVGCDGPAGVPSLTTGDPAAGGQEIRVATCTTLELGIWLRPGASEITIDDVAIRRAD